MGQVIIRNIDDRVLERLKARAAAQRKSLEQSLRELLTEATRPGRAELLAELERIRAMTPPREPDAEYPTAERLVREDRMPGELVVDASVALKWFLTDEPLAAEALAILRDGSTLMAPDILVAEVCNAAWRSARLGRILKNRCMRSPPFCRAFSTRWSARGPGGARRRDRRRVGPPGLRLPLCNARRGAASPARHCGCAAPGETAGDIMGGKGAQSDRLSNWPLITPQPVEPRAASRSQRAGAAPPPWPSGGCLFRPPGGRESLSARQR